MDDSLRHRAEEIFARVHDLDPGERFSVVESACGDDDALRREVDALLAAADGSAQYFDALTDRLGIHRFLAELEVSADRESAVAAGQTLGQYTVTERVGAGGMGEVWRAERSDGRFEGQVAVKVLSAAGGSARKRFALEGRYLARLSHPNIARLLDAGLTAAGVPYLVLEYVEGTPIDRYCDEQRLSIRARIPLFLDALAAVALAHTHLIVHRDIKPSNVLVTHQGVVKLLDFGIAKLVNEDTADGPGDLTREGGFALTPEFASPEQLTGDPVTTATDVYALGLLLYVLLAGQNPRRPEGRSYAELRTAATGEPPALAAGWTESLQLDARQLAGIAERRSASSGEVLRTLRGDVDGIVRKAMAVDPAERYPTVAEFAADLRRYLDNEPVTARPQTVGYRARKFVRRHRGAVFAGALAAAALLIATAITAWQSVEARRQRDTAVYQQQRAQASNEFLYLLLSDVGPGGKPLTPVQLLDRGVAMLDRQHGAAPKAIGRMLLDLADGYFSLGATARTLDLLGRAEQAARASHDPDLLAAALCGQAIWRYRDDPGGARAQVEQARASMARVRVLSTDTFVSCARAEAVIIELQGDRRSAIEKLLAARAQLTASPVASVTDRLHVDNQLVGLYLSERRLDRAAALNEEMLTTMEAEGQTGSLGYLITSMNQAFALQLMGEVKSAFEIRADLVDRVRELEQAGGAPRGFATGYANNLLRLARYDDAVQLLEADLEKSRAAGNRNEVAQSELTIGRTLALMKRYDESVARLDSAESYFRTAAAANDRSLAMIAMTRAAIRAGRGDSAGARQAIQDELARLGYPGRKDAPDLAQALRTAGEIAGDTGDPAAAERYATDFLAAAEQSARDPARSADVGYALLLRAKARLLLGSGAAARSDLERAVPSLTNGLGTDHPDTREALRLRARAPAE